MKIDICKKYLTSLLDIILPPRCLSCGAVLGSAGLLCPICWTRTHFIAPPLCASCGLPFAADPLQTGSEHGTTCLACTATPPRFRRARAAVVYDDASRPMILRFKHGDRTTAAPGLAAMMRRAGQELFGEIDLIAPVPLHRWRLFHRQYNQAALLAQAIGAAEGLEVIPDLLVRQRATKSQGGLGRRQRRRNVAGAFAVRAGVAKRVRGQRILLIDDVMTTGATLEACTRALRRAGASAVDCLVLARALRPGDGQ